MRTLPLLVILVPAASLPCQTLRSGGPLAGAAMAVSVDGGYGGNADATTLFKRNGFAGGPVGTAPPTGVTALDLQQILTAHGAPGLDVDDYSRGLDQVLVDNNGFVRVPVGRWGAFTFSLKTGAAGATGSRIEAEAAAGSIGAAIFSWVLPGSVMPAPLVGNLPPLTGPVERVHNRGELGLRSATPVEVDGLDLLLPLGLDQAGLQSLEANFAPLVVPQAIYFTVSSASVPQVTAQGWWTPAQASGATILRVLRSTTFGPWSAPLVWKTWSDLGLTQSEDIDALAVDEAAEKVVFSMAGGTRNQLLFVYLGTDVVTPEPVKVPGPTPMGTPVTTSVGIVTGDDVDAVCTLDPQVRNGGLVFQNAFGFSCGTPRPQVLFPNPQAPHASAYRRAQGNDVFYDTWMIGWPPATGQVAGFAAVFLSFGEDPDPAHAIPLGPLFVRNPLSTIGGDPQQFSLPMPGPPANVRLTGQRVTLRWFACDAALTELSEAWPVLVFL